MLKLQKTEWGITPIENIFIQNYMPMANEIQLKVYIMGLKLVDQICDDENINIVLAQTLNLTVYDIINAWGFWEDKKVIRIEPKQNTDSTDFSVIFLSLIDEHINQNYNNKSTSSVNSISDVIELNNNPQIAQMFNSIDKIMRRVLEPNERIQILGWIQKYNFAPNAITTAFEFAVESKNKKNLNYIKAILLDWYDQGLVTLDSINDYLISQSDEFSKYKKIYSELGWNTQNIAEAPKKIMEKWLTTFHFDLDYILFISREASMRSANPNIKYLDKIITDLYNNQITNIELYKEYRSKKSNASSINKTNEKQKSTKTKNRFHNFNQERKKYNSEQLEKILRH